MKVRTLRKRTLRLMSDRKRARYRDVIEYYDGAKWTRRQLARLTDRGKDLTRITKRAI